MPFVVSLNVNLGGTGRLVVEHRHGMAGAVLDLLRSIATRQTRLERIMSLLDDKLAALDVKLDEALAATAAEATEEAAQVALIEQLKADLADAQSRATTPEQLAAIDALAAKIETLKANLANVVNPTPAPAPE